METACNCGFFCRRAFEEIRARHAQQDKAAVVVQSAIRRFLAKKRLDNMKSDAFEKKIIISQIRSFSAVRRFLAKRQLERLKSDAFEEKIILLQSLIRGFLVRRKVNHLVQMKVEELELSLHKASSFNPVGPTTPARVQSSFFESMPSTPDLLRTLKKLRVEINKVKQHHNECEKALRKLSSTSTEEQAPVPLQIEELSIEEKAAITIQRFWRGHVIRNYHKDDIVVRKNTLAEYRKNIDKVDGSFDNKMSASARLKLLPDMLFDPSLYRNKVAAVAIDRIIRLSPHLCQLFVLEYGGLASMLDRMEQSDRSAGEREIISSLTSALSYIIRSAAFQLDVKEVVLKYSTDSLKILYHIMNAFYNNSEIVTAAVAGIVGFKSLDNSITYRSKYYITEAEKRLRSEEDSSKGIKEAL